MSLIDLARECVGPEGRNIKDKNRLVQIALAGRGGGMHTISDFPGILADASNKALRREYMDQQPTWAGIVRVVSAPDFKTLNRVQMGDAPELKKVEEHGEFTRGSIGEGKETYKVDTYGTVFAITRQAIVNDDTRAFDSLPRNMSKSARHLESDLVWGEITDNAALADGVNLFHADHDNLASSGGAIALATLSAGHAAIRQQTGLDGRLIDLRPVYLICPTGKEILARQQVASITPDSAANANPFADMLTVIAEPRFDASNANRWYLAADIAQTDIIELAMLDSSGPMIESRVGFDVDGLEMKIRHDCGAKVLDFRGLYRDNGA